MNDDNLELTGAYGFIYYKDGRHHRDFVVNNGKEIAKITAVMYGGIWEPRKPHPSNDDFEGDLRMSRW